MSRHNRNPQPTSIIMKEITVECPHCQAPFGLFEALGEQQRTALAAYFGAPKQHDQFREKIVAELCETHRLRDLEREKLIVDLRTSIQALQAKLAVSSQQSVGETLEIELLENLTKAFPCDKFTRVGKGRNGGDIIHTVNDRHGNAVGIILWEAKNTAAWSAKWLEKIRADGRDCRAQLSVIVTKNLPKEVTTFSRVEDVWVSGLSCYVGLALALRSQLVACALVLEKQKIAEASDALVTYVTGAEFAHRVSAFAFAATAIQNQLQREHQLLKKHWAEREKLAQTIAENVAGLEGDLKGLLGGQLVNVDAARLPLQLPIYEPLTPTQHSA